MKKIFIIDQMNTKIKTKEGQIYLWFDNSYFEKRKKGISKSEIERLEIKEKLHQFSSNAYLEYEEGGAPILLESSYSNISISHSQGWFALYFSNNLNGVDVQVFKNTLLKGKDYFVNSKDEEIELTKNNLHIIWGAKEAFYKKEKGNISDLKNEVSIVEINEKLRSIELRYKGIVEELKFRLYEDIVIVWT